MLPRKIYLSVQNTFARKYQTLYMLLFCTLFSVGIIFSAQAQEILSHEVQSGDTLSLIAELYEVSMADLMIFNRMDDADAIYLGQIIYLPPGAKKPIPDEIATLVPVEIEGNSESLDDAIESEIEPEKGLSIDTPSDTLSDTVISADTAVVTNVVGSTNRVTTTFRSTETLPEPLRIIPTPTSIPLVFTIIKPPMVIIKPTPSWSVDQASVVISSAVTVSVPSRVSTPEPEPLPILSPDEQLALDRVPAIDTLTLTANLNREYSVQSGDTLPLIALRTGVDYNSLLLLNRLTAEDTANLYIGQKLLLPATEREFNQSYTALQEEETYVVTPGDTLGGIAEKFELPWSLLLEANDLRNANAIYQGQTLIIPKSLDETAAAIGTKKQGPHVGPSQRGFNYYTVQRGDTLSSIAQDQETTQLALVEFNGLPDTETVFLGMELRVPYGPPDLPVRTPPVPTSGTAFLVSMSRQQCWVFQGRNVMKEWICSTGYGEWIGRTGTFAVQTMQENAKSGAYQLDMPYWLGIYDVGDFENGIHGLPVRWGSGEKIWEDVIGQPATFGCAMLADEDAKTLYDLSYIGMPVYIMQ